MAATLVGDTDQLLYRFILSRPELLTGELEQWLPNISTIKLEVNYRSHDEIIASSQRLIARNYSDLDGPYSQEFMKNASGIKGSGGNIQFQMYETAEDEALVTSAQILELIECGYSPSNFFIGARTRAQLGYLEGALVRAGIKFINITGGSFWQSKHVADVIAILRMAHNGDREAFKRAHNIASNDMAYGWNANKADPKKGKFQIGDYCPTHFLGTKFLAAINYDVEKIDSVYRAGKLGWKKRLKNSYKRLTDGQMDLQAFIGLLRREINHTDNIGQIIRVIIDNCYEKYLRHNGIDDEGLANAKLEDLATVEELAGKYIDIDKFLSYVDEMIQAAEDTKNKDWEDYVVLSTYHRLKGLERNIVFGIGWCEGKNIKTGEPVGLLPHTFSLVPPPNFGILPSGSQSPIEDERCIGFVCVSRAIERVYLSGIRSYRNYVMWPSRFIREMGLEETGEEEVLEEEILGV